MFVLMAKKKGDTDVHFGGGLIDDDVPFFGGELMDDDYLAVLG